MNNFCQEQTGLNDIHGAPSWAPPGFPFSSDVFCLFTSSAKDTKASIGQTRNFLVRASCRLRLEPNKEYLIMGLDGVTSDLKGE